MKRISALTILLLFYSGIYGQWNRTINSPVFLNPSANSTLSFQVLQQKFNLPTTDGLSARLSFLSNNWDQSNGIGLIDGDNVASPVIWMYDFNDRNAFTVARKGYSSGQGEPAVGDYLTPLFQVRSNGNVGIGTTTPQSTLDVNGSLSAASTVYFGARPVGSLYSLAPLNISNQGRSTLKTQLNLINGGGEAGAGSAVDFYSYIGEGNAEPGARFSAIDDGNYSNHFVFFTKVPGNQGNNGLSERMRINSSGQVGIGTVDLGDGNYKLFVESGIRTRKIKVDQVNWPDYVFAPTYKLPTLQEVEAFIQRYKHLPEVPSAKEVEEKGLDVGENQAVLLKKIEEQMLYILELNKKIEKLEAQQVSQEALLQKLNRLEAQIKKANN